MVDEKIPPLTCARLDAPVVLAHGLFGYDRIGLGRLTLSSYFRGIPGSLRAGGNLVLVTRVPPIAGVKLRARALARAIDLAFPGRPVHVSGHSMGGLDARPLRADPAWAGRVLSLTTVGTPHLGSAIADLSRVKAGRVYRLLRVMKIEHKGFLDLTRRAARAVNRGVPAPRSIPCFSVAGDPAAGHVCWPLKPFHEVLAALEGPNDGLVSVESALAFGTPLPGWPVDHFRQMNWLAPRSGPSSPASVNGLYVALLDNLARQGFAAKDDGPDPAAPFASKNARRVFPRGGPLIRSLLPRRAVE